MGQMTATIMITFVILPPQECGKLDPTYTSATLPFQKDPPANIQLFQVSTDGGQQYQGPLQATLDDADHWQMTDLDFM